ncbi:MAG: hypothetical protein MZU91_11125 [Desulfosudis oleivorans]|nr:hypothetical protein [Desulfosudis oleivorans]
MDGTMMIWALPARGRRQQPTASSRDCDVYAMFFTRAAYDRFRLSKEDFALLKEQEDKAKEEKAKADKDKPKDGKDAAGQEGRAQEGPRLRARRASTGARSA